ncbi:MAG: neutral/alkaline non-lysosomal ceramidase N-terminal domain-containing protein, partial [Oceanococcus sp.]
MNSYIFAHITFLASLIVLTAGCSDNGNVSQSVTRVQTNQVSARAAAQCAMNSPLLNIASGRDRPALAPRPPAGDHQAGVPLNGGRCSDNSAFALGSGIADITGNAGGSITVGYENPEHQTQGIHTRLYARAFAVHSPCNNKRVLLAVIDAGFIPQSVRQGVLERVAADPDMSPLYSGENIMLSATHTHSTPGGDSHDNNQNVFRLGYDALAYEVYTLGIYRALRSAHRNLAKHPQTGKIGLANGELLDANINRSPEAYALNPATERAAWLDSEGAEVNVDKRMLLIRFVRDDGTELGLLNWFGVHTTSLGIHVPAIGSDNKGYAALGFERVMQTGYGLSEGENTFVAAFAQEDEGDSSPNLCFEEFPFPDERIGCGVDTVQGNAISGSKQLAKALQLYDEANAPLRGGVGARLIHVDMNDVTVTDPEVLSSLQHPAELDAEPKRTCTAGLGVSFGAGAEDNRGHTEEGVSCANQDVVDHATRDLESAYDNVFQGYVDIPPFLLSNALCFVTPTHPAGDYSCQAEKPVLFPASIPPLPLQLINIGNLAIVGLPWEVTTTAARRLRSLVLDALQGSGVDSIVIAGLSNDYAQYMTTREEYASQQYEGASTLFGPWQLAAVMQEVRKLALSLRNDLETPPSEPAPVTQAPFFRRLPFIIADTPLPSGSFGAVLQDTQPNYVRGEIASVRFQGGHPRNDTLDKLESSYAYVERQLNDGSWEIVAQDRDPELQFRWWPLPSTQAPVTAENEVAWNIPGNAAPGIYRLRHNGTALTSNLLPAEPYVGISSGFEIQGPA